MLKYEIHEHKNFKVIYDMEKHMKRRHRSTAENYVKKFPPNTPNEEIEKYIEEKLGGNHEFRYW